MTATKVAARLPYTGDSAADHLLSEDPLALVIGMVLDQQVKLEKAFRGPYDLKQRLGHLDPRKIARMEPAALEAVFGERPALHRFPGSMARRVQVVSRMVVDEYDGDASRIWIGVTDAETLATRLLALPGFGEMKVKTLITILAKRLGVKPRGWERHAIMSLSLGDVDGPDMLAKYREFKRLRKAAAQTR